MFVIILQECKLFDRNINDLQHEKTELESKLSKLNDKLIQLQTNINDLIRNIEDIGATKLKVSIFCFYYYHLLIKMSINYD